MKIWKSLKKILCSFWFGDKFYGFSIPAIWCILYTHLTEEKSKIHLFGIYFFYKVGRLKIFFQLFVFNSETIIKSLTLQS